MLNIVVVFPKKEIVLKMKNVLIKNGFDVSAVCVTGAQAIQAVERLEAGVVVCGIRFADMNIDVLPATLGEACDAFEEDKYIQEVLGEHISKKYLEAKRKEWHEYCRQVSDWETEAYLYKY